MALTPEQLEVRRRLVTASAVPIITGDSPFKSLDELLWEKTDPLYVQDLKDYQQRGHDLEQPVADWTARKLGYKAEDAVMADEFFEEHDHLKDGLICMDTVRAKSDQYPWAACTPDRIIPRDGKNIVCIECKTSSSSHGWGHNSVPRYIWIQCQWQMFVLRTYFPNLDTVFVGALVQSNFRLREVKYDVVYLRSIWPQVVNYIKTINRLLDSKTIHPRPVGRTVDLTMAPPIGDHRREVLERFSAAHAKRKEAMDEFDAVKNEAAIVVKNLSPSVLLGSKILTLYPPRPRLDQTNYILELEEIARQAGWGHDDLARLKDQNMVLPDPEDAGYIKIGKGR